MATKGFFFQTKKIKQLIQNKNKYIYVYKKVNIDKYLKKKVVCIKYISVYNYNKII